jgi:hypothetical protein
MELRKWNDILIGDEDGVYYIAVERNGSPDGERHLFTVRGPYDSYLDADDDRRKPETASVQVYLNTEQALALAKLVRGLRF